MNKFTCVCLCVSSFLLGISAGFVWNDYHVGSLCKEKPVELVLVGVPRSVHIMGQLDLSDPQILDGRLKRTYLYGRNFIVGPVAEGIVDLTKEGKLVYWNDQDNKLYCSLVRDDRVVAEVNIPSGWTGYNLADLIRDFRKVLTS